MQINLNLKKSQFAPYAYSHIFDYSHRFEMWMGSAGSAKSYSIAQKLIIRCCSQKIKILVCRKYGSTIRNSCYSLFKEILSKWKLSTYVKTKESDFTISFPNGSQIIMLGLDEETKLLSLNDIGTIWIEEAYEITQDLLEQLNLRMRSKIDGQQIIMSWNPISKNSWLYDFWNNPPSDSIKIFSTYLDNPFLPQSYISALEEMKIRNPNKARIYCYGEWGVNPEGLVITSWRTEDFDEMSLAKTLERRAGMDVGFIDPSAIIDTLFDRENRRIYVFNEFYQSGCQLNELKDAIIKMNLKNIKLQVDSAEPRTIQYFKSNNINATPCIKGANSVNEGYKFLQDMEIIVKPSCKSLINELENFSYIKSKITGEYTDNTTHEFSHSIDALRYAYSDIYKNNKLKSIHKDLL